MTVNIKFVIYALIIILGTLGLLDDDNLSGENIFYSLLKWVSFILFFMILINYKYIWKYARFLKIKIYSFVYFSCYHVSFMYCRLLENYVILFSKEGSFLPSLSKT